MIDEEKLDILQTQGWAKGFREDCDFNDLIRLARLGLQAEAEGLFALRDMRMRNKALADWAEQFAIPALIWEDKRCGKVYGPLGDALAALPKEGE